jgi:ATP-dependent DNA ligase
VCERALEVLVAKRVDSRYIPGYRGWTKIENRNYWRYDLEREAAFSQRRPRVFV